MRGAIFILCSFILALQTNTAETGRGECGGEGGEGDGHRDGDRHRVNGIGSGIDSSIRPSPIAHRPWPLSNRRADSIAVTSLVPRPAQIYIVCLSVCWHVCLCVCLSVYPPVCSSALHSVCLSVFLPLYLTFRSLHLHVILLVCLSFQLCVSLPSSQ